MVLEDGSSGGDPTVMPETVGEAVKNNTTFTENKEIQDKNGNTLTVPSGFKIATKEDDDTIVYKDESNPTVQDGIVIEDATNGNQFVWIPVGKEIKIANDNGEGTKTIEIALERRTFGYGGTVTKHTAEGTEVLEECFIEQTKAEQDGQNYGNVIAKDIEEFKRSVATNGGYYLARFEASGSGEEPAKSVKGETPWASITQPDASARSQAMYNDKSKGYQSDLVNSYAFDTAIYYIQECSGDTDYAMQVGESKTGEKGKTGENILKSTDERDQKCNICDMAGNVDEFSTESSTWTNKPWTSYGCYYKTSARYASFRAVGGMRLSYIGFRPLVYVK